MATDSACSIIAPQDAEFEVHAQGSAVAEATLLYDADCGFCARTARHLRWFVGERIAVAPCQHSLARFPGLEAQDCARAVQYIARQGARASGAEAFFRVLALVGGPWRWPLRAYRRSPMLARSANCGYEWVAARRPWISRWTRRLAGPPPERRGARLTRRAFEAGLGTVAAIAFLSLWLQIDGLCGASGLAPASEALDAARQTFSGSSPWVRWLRLPTACWISTSDVFLHSLCLGGTLAALAAALGIAPRWMLLSAWAAYLSLANVCRPFLDFQWDSLLLEMLFLGALWADRGVRSRLAREREPAPAVQWLLRLLLVRLMVGSALVKLLGGDPAWSLGELSALRWHYETQPLPNAVAWYAHHLPMGFHCSCVALMYGAELLLPLVGLGPRRLRVVAFVGLVLFQVTLALTGNYGYFHLLGIVLCVPLLDDGVLARITPQRLLARLPVLRIAPRIDPRVFLVRATLVGALLVAAAAAFVTRTFEQPPQAASAVARAFAPWRTVNGYGLFQVLTKSRPEVVLEISSDGRSWSELALRHKPGPLARRPDQVAPHMPRLDWQLWFVALGSGRRARWFRETLPERLLAGEPHTLAQFVPAARPQPARYVRARLYEYHFTTPAERAAGGNWWRRDLLETLFVRGPR